MSQTEAEQAAPLLLATTAALESEQIQKVVHDWDGPRVAVASHTDSPDAKRALLDAGWFVVDYLTEGSRSAEALCAVMKRIAKPIGTPRGNFLYVGDGALNPGTALAGLNEPCAVVHEIDARDELVLLGLGRGLTSHPLFWDFFDVASDIEIDSGTFLTLLRASLAEEAA